MNNYCDSIVNPWGRGLTHLGWKVDPLVDPDYDHILEIDPVRLWTVGLTKLPQSARIEFLAVAFDRSERLLGIVEGKRSAALQLVTDANETLAIRSDEPFSAPAPTLLRSWMFPFAAHDVGFEPAIIASTDGLVAVAMRDHATRIFDTREASGVGTKYKRSSQAPDSRERRVSDALAREEVRGREAWATLTRLNRDTIAVMHRGQVLIGSLGILRRVQ